MPKKKVTDFGNFSNFFCICQVVLLCALYKSTGFFKVRLLELRKSVSKSVAVVYMGVFYCLTLVPITSAEGCALPGLRRKYLIL